MRSRSYSLQINNHTLLNVNIEKALNIIKILHLLIYLMYMDVFQLSNKKHTGNLLKTDFRANALEKIHTGKTTGTKS